jgi:hypothetical protein
VRRELSREHLLRDARRREHLHAQHRERRFGLAREIEEALVGVQVPRARRGRELIDLQHREAGAELDAVTLTQLDLLVGGELATAHRGAVGAAQIDQPNHAAAHHQLGVLARCSRVIESNLGVVTTTDDHRAFWRQRERRRSGLGHDDHAPSTRSRTFTLRGEPDRLLIGD